MQARLRFGRYAKMYLRKWMSCLNYLHLLLVFIGTSVISQEPKGRERLSTLHRDAEKNLLTVILQYQQEECFYQYTHVNTILRCTFQTPEIDTRVSVRHSGPKGFISDKESSFATLVTNVTKEGSYEYCFTNLSPGPHLLGFYLSVIDDETILRSYNGGERDTTPPELKKMWETVAYIGKRLRLISLDTHRHLRLVTDDRRRAMEKFTYVNHWSLAQCILIVTAGVAQVSIVRYILRPAKPLASKGPTY